MRIAKRVYPETTRGSARSSRRSQPEQVATREGIGRGCSPFRAFALQPVRAGTDGLRPARLGVRACRDTYCGRPERTLGIVAALVPINGEPCSADGVPVRHRHHAIDCGDQDALLPGLGAKNRHALGRARWPVLRRRHQILMPHPFPVALNPRRRYSVSGPPEAGSCDRLPPAALHDGPTTPTLFGYRKAGERTRHRDRPVGHPDRPSDSGPPGKRTSGAGC